MRSSTGSHDSAIFARSALRTKSINVRPLIMRGGFRF